MRKKYDVRGIVGKMLIFCIFAILAVIPIVMMCKLSKSEQETYVQDKQYEFRETSYGAPVVVSREDVQQYYTISGEIISNAYNYIDLGANADDSIEVYVNTGDEVLKDDTVANVNGRNIKSTYNGIVDDINLSDKCNIKLKSLDKLALACNLDKNIANIVRSQKTLTLEDGRKVTVKRVSNIMTDNKIQVIFEIEDCEYTYGETVSDIKVFTGKVFTGLLVVDKNAVYKKLDNIYYIRKLDSNANFVEEVPVEVNYETETLIGITGVEEGTICDSGYKNLVEEADIIEEE